jgi:hypothetical protein
VDNLGGIIFWVALFAWMPLTDWLESRKKEVEIEAQKLALEKKKMEFEAQKLLLEKCQSSAEVNQFLSTDAGQRFLERMKETPIAPPVPVNPLGGIMALIVFGALCMGLGLAFYLLSRLTTHSGFIIPAFLLAVPGLGFLIGAAASYHLKKKWGLLERNPAAPAG